MFPGGSDSRESACKAGDPGLIPRSWKIPGRRECLPTPVFVSGEFHGQKSQIELDLNHSFVVILISSMILSDDSRGGSRAEEGKNSLHKMIDRD